jgi:hypothetical protein
VVHFIAPVIAEHSSLQAIFLLSPDTVFSQDGHGKSSGIQYKNLFYSYKKILVCCWDTPFLTKIRQHIEGHIFGAAKLPVDTPHGEDFTGQIVLAMAGLQSNDADQDLDSTPDDSAQVIEATQSSLNSLLSTSRLSVHPEIPSDGSRNITPPILPLINVPVVAAIINQDLLVDDDAGEMELNNGVTGTIDAEDHGEGNTRERKKKKSGHMASAPHKSVRQKKNA